jgi:hypothetical protein
MKKGVKKGPIIKIKSLGNKISLEKKCWLVAVDMGYGHLRTAYPLRYLAFGEKIINANRYPGIPLGDQRIWENSRNFYEAISRFKKVPLIGDFVFSIYDKLQKIFSFYPKIDQSKPDFILKNICSLIEKGWGKHFIEQLKFSPYTRIGKDKRFPPFVTTFFIPAFMAEFFGYPGEIFCIPCDADISRTWVPLYPKRSRIKYLAPNTWVQNRLKLYGVKEENIFLTGHPLPLEDIGTQRMEILKEDLRNRILNLDPRRRYLERYKALVKKYLKKLPKKSDHPLTLMFTIGGAGAQKEIGIKIIKSLRQRIKFREIKIIIAAGKRLEVKEYFENNIKMLGLRQSLGKNIAIIFNKDAEGYFREFNEALRKTDILWIKPSELSFFTALGLPIIIAPPIGSQEKFNRKWLLHLGSGMIQENPDYTDQWLFDFLNSGVLAECAMQGFVEAEKLGTFKIGKIIFKD